MEIKQGRMLCLLMGLLSLISCKIYENRKHDKQEETARTRQHLELRQRLYTFQQDTLSRRWYFWTDSAFRFHADSGLFAQSGTVLVQESEGRIRKQLQELTQKNEQEKQQETRHEKGANMALSTKSLWAVGLVLVLVLLWRWSRFRL